MHQCPSSADGLQEQLSPVLRGGSARGNPTGAWRGEECDAGCLFFLFPPCHVLSSRLSPTVQRPEVAGLLKGAGPTRPLFSRFQYLFVPWLLPAQEVGTAQLVPSPKLLLCAQWHLEIEPDVNSPSVSHSAFHYPSPEWPLGPVGALFKVLEDTRDLGKPQIATSTQRARCLKKTKSLNKARSRASASRGPKLSPFQGAPQACL